MDQRILEIILRARDEASAAVERATGRISKSFKAATGASKVFAAGLVAAGVAIGGLTLYGANYAGQMESLQVALETVTGSAEDAARAMTVIRKTAAESPFFETSTLAQFVQVMAASGQQIDTAVASALRFGDVAAAFGKGNAEMTRMGNTLSQVIGKGKADVVDMKELVNAGWVSVRKDTAAAMGVSMARFEEMVSEGLVGYEQISKAAEKFTGSAIKQSNTWGAIIQRMQESFQDFVANVVIDTGIFDALKGAIESFIAFMDEHGETIGAGIKNFIQWCIDNWPILAGIIMGALLPAMVLATKAFIAGALALAPFIALGAALGLLAKVIMDNWEPISTFFTDLWATLTGALDSAIRFVQEKIEWFKENWAVAIGYVIGFFATLPITLPLLVIAAIVKIVQYLMSVDWGRVFSNIGKAFGAVWDAVKGAAINAFNYLKSINWGELLSNIGKGIGNAIIGLIEGAIKGATAGIPVLGDALKDLRIPRFKDGGWTKEGLAYLHDGEYVMSKRELAGFPRADSPVGDRPGDVNITIHAQVSRDIDIQDLGQRLAWEMKLAGGY